MKNAGTVLLYNCSAPEFSKLKQIFAMLRLRMRVVEPDRYHVPLEELAQEPPGIVRIEEKVEDGETAFAIHQFLHGMAEPYKEVFTLRVFGELPYEKIGRLFGKSAGWARVTFYRAKVQISEHMEAMEHEGD